MITLLGELKLNNQHRDITGLKESTTVKADDEPSWFVWDTPSLALKIPNPGKSSVLGKLGQLVTLFLANIRVAGLV